MAIHALACLCFIDPVQASHVHADDMYIAADHPQALPYRSHQALTQWLMYKLKASGADTAGN